MEERPAPAGREEGIDTGRYFAVLRREWWKIALLSMGAGLVALLLTIPMDNIYQSTAVIAPPTQEGPQNPTLGMLATLGVNLGGATKVEDLESLFRSNDLTVRVFRKYKPWPILCDDCYNQATGKLRSSWLSRLFDGQASKMPGDWDAIRAAESRLKVFINRRAGTVSVSFESPSPSGSADIVRHYLDEGKNHLQEEALDRAVQNKKFIEEQIRNTIDPLTRDRLYSLYGQEIEREMMARNREQFGFRVVDSPRASDRKVSPKRAGIFSIVSLVVFFFAFTVFFTRDVLATKTNSTNRSTY